MSDDERTAQGARRTANHSDEDMLYAAIVGNPGLCIGELAQVLDWQTTRVKVAVGELDKKLAVVHGFRQVSEEPGIKCPFLCECAEIGCTFVRVLYVSVKPNGG